MNEEEKILKAKRQLIQTQIVKEIIRIIFVIIFLIVGFIGALVTKDGIFTTLILFGMILLGIGKDPMELIGQLRT